MTETNPDETERSIETEPSNDEVVEDETLESDDDGSAVEGTFPRRGALALLTALGLGTAATGNASAASGDHLGELWDGSPGTGRGLETVLREKGQALKGTAGTNTNDTNDIGVKGTTYSTRGIGLEGLAAASSGNTVGLKGRTDSPDGTALFGIARNANPGSSFAVEGLSQADDGTAIQGRAEGSGNTVGVEGQVDSPDGYGLSTPDDAKVDGKLSTTSEHHVRVDGDRGLRIGPQQVLNSSFDAGGNVIGGFKNNSANGNVGVTIAGGGLTGSIDFGLSSGPRDNTNEVTGQLGTIGGGANNRAGRDGTVSGGVLNTASGDYSTVGGGREHIASHFATTVGGGRDNIASAADATVPGGFANEAAGKTSFAAGRKAKALHDGTFVWSDWANDSFSSTGADQFLIDAAGGVGIGTDSPVGQRLGIEGDVATSGSLARHVVTITNTSGDDTGDILGLRTQVSDPPGEVNFISFTDPDGQVGQIDGDGSGGVNYKSASADLAEYFPAADPRMGIEPGDVVGLDAGELVADPTAADNALVVSDAPMVTGNAPLDEDGDGLACVALLGQVAVQVGAPVEAGDLLVATADGTAVPAACGTDTAPIVGRALEGGDADGLVDTFVAARPTADSATGTDQQAQPPTSSETTTQALRAELAQKNDRIDELEAQNEELEVRLTALEERVASMETGQPWLASADD